MNPSHRKYNNERPCLAYMLDKAFALYCILTVIFKHYLLK